jgi:hypothetical protein
MDENIDYYINSKYTGQPVPVYKTYPYKIGPGDKDKINTPRSTLNITPIVIRKPQPKKY